MRVTIRRGLAVTLLVIGAAAGPGCSSIDEGRDAVEVFERMEQRLLYQDRIGFTVRSEGVLESSFEGWISHEGGELAMAAEGQWAGDPVAVSAETTSEYLVLNTTTRMERIEREPFVAVAVLIGLSRMGVLHNLARVVAGRGPDRADGSVRNWVKPENIVFVGNDTATIRFDIVVNGTPSGVATVRVDPQTGLPVHREQSVEFPQGTMTVFETYRYY